MYTDNTYKQKCFVSEVVYIHNNSQSEVEEFFKNIINNLNSQFENAEVVIVVDDDSVTDYAAIKKILDNDSNGDTIISIVRLAYYQGLEAAMCAGIDMAVGDFVFEFDSIDSNYDKDIPVKMYEKTKEGFDIVAATDKNDKLFSRIFYRIINSGKANKIQHDTIRLVSRRALNRVKKMNTSVLYRKYQYMSSGLPYAEIGYEPVRKITRRRSKGEKSDRWNSGINYMMMYTRTIEKATTVLCCIFLFVTIAAGIWALYSLGYDTNLASGWVSLMGIISFGFFGIFLMIAFMFKYINIILNINTKKMDYIVESVDKL